MKNVLFNLEKLKLQQELLSNIRKAFDNMQVAMGDGINFVASFHRRELYLLADSIRELQDMPDFVDSEEDVENVAVAINEAYALRKRDEPMVGGKDTYLAQAAINALQYKKEGSE